MINNFFLDTIDQIQADEWNRLFGGGNLSVTPFISHEFLQALEQSHCASSESGWQPRHLLLRDDQQQLLAAMPLYQKSHSFGEYVFDWNWVQAYMRRGLHYYPKLVSAIPFTPVTSRRLGIAPGVEPEPIFDALIQAVQQAAREWQLSSWHLLFPDTDELTQLQKKKQLLQRFDVQFHWFNHQYANFDEFLLQLRSSKRKQIRRERRRVLEQDVSISRKLGNDISADEWQAFYQCYCHTYLKLSHHSGYLNRTFFDLIFERMRHSLMLVICRYGQKIVASALFFFDDEQLYGRYWGALEDINCLHFEACFYQGIEFCIEQQLKQFNSGAQGPHKLLRGFEPITTSSFHWLADPALHQAVASFLRKEADAIDNYQKRAEKILPFKRGD